MFRLLARLLVGLRWLLVPAWVAAAVLAWLYLPALPATNGLSLQSVVPSNAEALQAQEHAVHQFGFPVLTRTVVVVRNPHGLSPDEQGRLVAAAVHPSAQQQQRFPQIAAAVPVTDAGKLFPSSRESSTTAVVYLFFRPGTDVGARPAIARRWAADVLPTPHGATVSVVGPIDAEQAQGGLITGALPWVEIGTIAVVVVVVGLRFRSVIAPILVVVAAGISFVLDTRLLGWLAHRYDFAVPGALEPLLIVLLVGVGTDYAVFLLAGFQEELGGLGRPHEAMARAGRSVLPIVTTAGVAVAAGTLSLLVAHLPLFRRLGPGMAITVLVTLLVMGTFIPAATALLGRAALWPSAEARLPGRAPGRDRIRRGTLRVVVHPAAAVVVLLVGAALLGAGIYPLQHFRMGANVVADLPSSAEPARALAAAEQGFAPGIIAPTELVLSGPGIADRRDALQTVQRRLAAVPGVAGVLGPEQQPSAKKVGAVYAPSGDAVRMLVILRDAPYGARAVDDLARLRQRLPGVLAAAGLHPSGTAWAGDTAVVAQVVGLARSDLLRVSLAALGILLVILMLFLRAVVAPVFLLLASAAVVATALGATYWLFSDLTDVGGPTFFMPVAAAVLLIAFGSDYNIFLVGRIRESAQRQRWRDAVVTGGAEGSRAIASAGIALAGSFAMLALVPLTAFRQFAFAMVVGVLLDTYVVRSYVVPAGLALLGRAAGWPGRRLGRGVTAEPTVVS